MGERKKLGPRGGETTRTKSGLFRTTVSFHEDEWEALRAQAYQDNTSKSDLVRAAVRAYLGIED